MEFVVHNRSNMTLRATLVVAFFASFFAHGGFTDDVLSSGINLSTPKLELNFILSEGSLEPDSYCLSQIPQTPQYKNIRSRKLSEDISGNTKTTSYTCDFDVYSTFGCPSGVYCTFNGTNSSLNFNVNYIGVMVSSCPGDTPEHVAPLDIDEDGQVDKCFNPADMDNYLIEQAENKSVDDFCKRLVLDSGNNSAGSMCYTAPSGVSCNVSRQSGSDYSYYSGTGQNIEGCSQSTEPHYDDSGTGSESDGCFSSGGVNYCEANKNKHCSNVQGSEICDDGCLETQAGFYCDAARHPDVGEGDSDYFDDKGTCSIVAGSTYRGACEELGGEWTKEGDYTNTSCPSTSISGTCSVGTSGGCFACLDAGGTWEPDPNAPLNNTEKGIQDVASLTQKTNDNLKTLELTNRKGNEALISTIKSTNDKILGELKVLSGKGSGGVGAVVAKLDELKEEEKPYTTTTDNNDRSLINGLFSEQKIAEVKASSEEIKTNLQTFITTSKAELSTLLTISAPNSSGYQSRSVDIKGSSFDLSLNRFSQYFSLLAGPVMLICSVIALFIILGRNS